MTRASRHKGFFTIDALFSIIPIILLSLILMQVSSELSGKAREKFRDQEVFDKLVSVADHTVKIGAAVGKDKIRHPNWIVPEKLGDGYSESMRARAGLSALHVSLEEPDGDYSICIYRLVVVGAEKSISKLFVCGE
jgi:hypothetical protein